MAKILLTGAFVASNREVNTQTTWNRSISRFKGLKYWIWPVAGGGHALAFAQRGASVTASDINDHSFNQLTKFCAGQNLSVKILVANCQALPLDEQFDIILALDLIEHIPDPQKLANEIKRLLAPNGICILTTPAKLLSVFWREPHWQLYGLSLLPFRLQAPIAKHIFGRHYPFPIERQYWHSSQIEKLFPELSCTAIQASKKLPLPTLAWGSILIKK